MTGLPRVPVDDILIHPRDRDLILATHGRSIWICDDITPLEQLPSANGDMTLFQPRESVQWKNDPSAQRNATNRDFKGSNPQGGTAISVWAKSDLGAGHVDFLQGTTLMSTMNVDIKAGLNRFQWGMQGIPNANAAANGGANGRRGGGRNGGGGGGGGRGGNNAGGDQAAGAAGGAGAAGTNAAGAAPNAADFQGGGGGGRGRGGAGRGVPFVFGGGRGGGFGGGACRAATPAFTRTVRLTVGDKTAWVFGYRTRRYLDASTVTGKRTPNAKRARSVSNARSLCYLSETAIKLSPVPLSRAPRCASPLLEDERPAFVPRERQLIQLRFLPAASRDLELNTVGKKLLHRKLPLHSQKRIEKRRRKHGAAARPAIGSRFIPVARHHPTSPDSSRRRSIQPRAAGDDKSISAARASPPE